MKPCLTATVISAGRMMCAVKVRSSKQTWNARIQKHFTHPTHHLVADPTSALRAGDVIRMEPEPHSRHIKHIVAEIISPWGVPIHERPAVLTPEERQAARGAKRGRREARREAEAETAREGTVEEDGVEGRREKDRGTVRMAGRTERQRDRALEHEAAAGRIQSRLDGKGLEVGEVERRMEQARL